MTAGAPRPARRRPSWRVLLGALLCAWLARPEAVEAGIAGRCDRPVVFGGAAVNLVLLPYTYAGATDRDRVLSSAAANLATLIQLDALSSARYGSLGVPALRGTPQECDLDRILSEIRTRQSELGALQRGGGVVVLWGRFFESEGAIYVQSYLTFFRHGVDELIGTELREGGSSLRFQARLPAHSMSFGPRRVTRTQLEEINRTFSETNVVRSEPDDSAPPVAVDPFRGKEFLFRVASGPEGWLKLEPFSETPPGYVRLGSELSTHLKSTLPELHFVDGLIGYLAYRARRDHADTFDFRTPSRIVALIARSMKRYRDAVNPRREPLPLATSVAILSTIGILEPEASFGADASRGEIAAWLSAATGVLPDNAGLLNLKALSRVRACCAGPIDGAAVEELEDSLYRALVIAPEDKLAPANLLSLYHLLERRGDPNLPFSIDDLKRRIEAIEGLLGYR